MEVRITPGFWPDLEKMARTVRDAGFQPVADRVELVITGSVVKQGEALAIELEGMKTPTTLPVIAAKGKPQAAADLARHVGQVVEVEGLWQPNGDGRLAVTAIRGAMEARKSD